MHSQRESILPEVCRSGGGNAKQCTPMQSKHANAHQCTPMHANDMSSYQPPSQMLCALHGLAHDTSQCSPWLRRVPKERTPTFECLSLYHDTAANREQHPISGSCATGHWMLWGKKVGRRCAPRGRLWQSKNCTVPLQSFIITIPKICSSASSILMG